MSAAAPLPDATGPVPLLLVNAAQVVTCAGPPQARRGAAMADAGVREGVGVALCGGRVVAVDPEDQLRRRHPGAQEVDCQRGLVALDGLEMLVQQGAAALELWLQRPVPVATMRQALVNGLDKR
jgi:hypothetical protein